MSEAAHIDVNLLSVYQNVKDGVAVPSLDGLDLTAASLAGIDTPLKISHSTGLSGVGLKIPGGNETSIDIDVCSGITLSGDFGLGYVKSMTPLRIKGNSHHVKFVAPATLHSRGSRGVDVELGDWMDQDYGASGAIDLAALKHSDGGKIRVAVGWVVPFTVKLGPNCVYAILPSIELKIYVPVKRLLRWILRIPVGAKGPSWF